MKSMLMTVLLVVGMVMAAGAAPAPKKFFAGTGTDRNTNSYYVVSGNGIGAPVINYLSVATDKAAGQLKFYTLTVATALSGATAAGQVAITNVISTNSLAGSAGRKIVIRNISTDTYQFSEIMNTTNQYQITLTNLYTVGADSNTVALAAGDLIYTVTAAGALDLGITGEGQEFSNASGIYAGTQGVPLLLLLDGTATNKINVVSGEYR